MKGGTPRQAAGCLSSRHRQGTGYFQDHGAQVRRLPGNAGQPDSQAVHTITNLPKFRWIHPLSTNPDVFCQSLPVVTRGWLFRRYVVAYGSFSRLLNGAIRSWQPCSDDVFLLIPILRPSLVFPISPRLNLSIDLFLGLH